MLDDYAISIRLESCEGCIAQKHVGNTSYRTAKSYLKHFNKLNRSLWDDKNQTGIYCMIALRERYIKHSVFETTYNANMIDYKM